MYYSFTKSIIFHILVIFLLFFISDILNFSKKTIITEIPIEVVDVSKKTTIKKKAKKEIKKKVIENFTPPNPISKPNIPEFIEKKKERKEKKKKKVEVKEEKKEINRLSSILKSIDRIKVNKNNEKKNDEITEQSNLGIEEKLTISELDMIRRQFISCWNIPAGAKNIENLKVLVKIRLDEEGNVIDSELVKTNNLSDTFYRAAAESAMRAVRHPSCKKLKVPVKKYNTWKNITLNFDPSVMGIGR